MTQTWRSHLDRRVDTLVAAEIAKWHERRIGPRRTNERVVNWIEPKAVARSNSKRGGA